MSPEHEEGPPTGEPRFECHQPHLKSSPSHAIRDELVVVHVEGVGKVAAMLPVIPDDAPYRIREGITRRRLVAISGECPCGATLDHAAVRRGGARGAEVQHERLCPADTASLTKAIRRWSR